MPKKVKTTNTGRLAGVCSGAWENRTPDILLAKRGHKVRRYSWACGFPRFSSGPVVECPLKVVNVCRRWLPVWLPWLFSPYGVQR